MSAPLGCQSTRPGPDLILDRNQVQLFAQFSMVSPFDFFEFGEMGVQFGLASETRCRRSAAAWVPLVAAPIRAAVSRGA